jgi:TolB-like protein/DNA-binding winged helix-turn-helix (wHTH) protein
MVTDAENLPARYRINDLVLDSGLRRVTRGDQVLTLGALTFDLLLALAECSPSMATYDQLVEQVWQGREVSPETIAQRAKLLRVALSEDAKSPRYFEPIRGKGYRLVADAERLSDRPKQLSRPAWKGLAAAAAVLLLLVVVSVMQKDELSPSVAVLPFVDLSAQRDQQYFADGIAEELINELAGLDGLKVASRTESFFYSDPTDDLQKVGKQLGVAAILEGSVRKLENEVRITVQLIEVATGYHLWSRTFDREPQDIFAVQEDIARSVAGALGVTMGVGGVNEFRGAGTRNFEAYEAYLRGEYDKAIQLDPNYAGAWARRGLRIVSTMWVHAPEEAPAIIERGYQDVAKALELDPQSARVQIDFATLIYATMDWERADQAFARATSLDRTENALGNYANMLMRAGRSSAAIALYEEADLLLRTPDPVWHGLRFNAYLALGRYDQLKQEAARLSDAEQRILSLRIVLNDGSEDELREAMDAKLKNSISYRELFSPFLELLDSPADAVELMAELANDPDKTWPSKYHDIAMLAAYLGEPKFAFEVLLRDVRYTTIRFGVLWYPVMSEVRRLPEFKQFVTDVNLVSYWRKHGWSDFCRPLGSEDFVCE